MKKLTLFAMAVPALFAACSQEDIVTNTAEQPSELLGKVAGDVTFVNDIEGQTRAIWSPNANEASGVQWNPMGDAFSLFWVGDLNNMTEAPEKYIGKTNALYESKDGAAFESNNIIYEGNHVIVYPADLTHATEKAITVSIPEPQKASDDLGEKRTVVVSDVLTIKGEKAETDPAETIYAGYNASLSGVGMATLSSHMVLNLEFDLKKLGSVEIQEVRLVASSAIFATSGNLLRNSEGFVSLVNPVTTNTLTLKVDNAVVNTENKKYTAQIGMLPPVVTELSGVTYKIEVLTNYGLVVIDKAFDVTRTDGAYQFDTDDTTAKTDDQGNKYADKDTDLGFDATFRDIATRELDTDNETTGNQSEPTYGKRIIRNVKVDMSKASIANWPVTTSDELLRAYEMYDNLERGASDNKAETFVLVGKTIGEANPRMRFDLTPEATAEIQNHEHVTLALAETNTLKEIVLIPSDKTSYTEVPDLTGLADDTKAEVKLGMGEGNTWTQNIYNAALIKAYKSFENYGNVTLVAEQNKNEDGSDNLDDDLTEFKSGGTAVTNFKQTVTDKINYDLAGVVNIEEGQTLTLAGTSTFNVGSVLNIDGTLRLKEGSVTLSGTTNVAGSLLTSVAATCHNQGVINVTKEKASVIITSQANWNANETNGIINLMDRDDYVSVANSEKMGRIKWVVDENVTSLICSEASGDVFNYAVINHDVTYKGGVKYLEVAGNKIEVKSSDKTVSELILKPGTTLVIPTGSTLTADMAYSALSNGVGTADIEVYGTFNCENIKRLEVFDYNYAN